MSIVGMRKFMAGRLQHIMLALAFVFAVGWIGICIGSGRFEQKQEASGGPIAKINGEKLDRLAFEQKFQNMLEDMLDEIREQQGSYTLSAFEEGMIRGRMFDEIVDQMLRIQAAEKEGIKVSRRELKTRIDQIIEAGMQPEKQRLLAGYKGKKTDEAFNRELRKYGTSLSEFKSSIRRNIDVDNVRQSIMVAKLGEKWKSSIDSSDKAVRESFDEVRFRQITISVEKRPVASAERRARELLEKLRKGADFVALAREHSEDPLKETGGERGYFMRRTYMESELANVVFKLKPGEVGGPIKMPLGYTIVKLDERRSALPADFNDPKKKKLYRETYLAEEQSRVLREYPEKLRRSARIQIYDPELRGYTLLREMSTIGFFSPAARKAQFEAAVKECQKAVEQSQADPQAVTRAYAQIGYLYDQMRRPEFGLTKEEQVKYRAEAEKALQAAWEGSGSNDLDLMLADIYLEESRPEKALEHLETASETATDPRIHRQLLDVLEGREKELGSANVAGLIAQERKWLTDYDERMRERQRLFGQPQPVAPKPRK